MTESNIATSDVVTITKNWVEQFIVQLNICPFAKKEVVNKTIQYREFETDINELDKSGYLSEGWVHQAVNHFTSILVELNDNPEKETALVIYKNDLQDFDCFLDWVDMAQHIIEQLNFVGQFQIATFHPHYLFAGEDQDAVSHYTNRSPFPVLHIIRESSISSVLKHYKNPQQIPENNIQMMQKLGKNKLEQMMQDFKTGLG